MKVSGERYFPRGESIAFAPFEPFISYEHWHRYCYALQFVAGKSVLDIASGEGYGSAYLAAHAALVYGVDLSGEAIEHARQSYVRDNLHYVQGPADQIPIPGEHCFDVIVSFETVEHLDEPTQERFAAEIRRLLKPDGILLISTPNRATYSREDGQGGNPYHFHEFTKDEFVAFLHRSFAHVRLLSQHVYPISYIWDADGRSGSVVEYQISLDGGTFRPAVGDGKEIGYLIAVCTHQDERAVASDSILVDLSEVAFRAIPRVERWQNSSLFLDSGLGFRAEEMVGEEIEYCPGFSLKFTLDPDVPVRQLRWDPLEMRLSQVRLHQILWQDGDGLIARLDLSRLTSNGLRRDEATFEFETLDPMIYLPISGSVASVTIEGECVATDESATLAGLERAMCARAQQLAQRDHDLQAARRQLAEHDQTLVQQAVDLHAARQQIVAHDQSINACRQQITRQEHDLQATRRQLALHEHKVAALTRDLEERAQQIQHLEWVRATLEASLQCIVQSRRWILMSRVQEALYYLPRRLRSTWRRVLGTGRHEQRTTVAAAPRWHALADRAQGRDSRSNQETETTICG